MCYTFVVTLLICKGTFFFFLKERTFLHHFYIIIGGGKNDVKFDVKSLVV